MLGERHSHPMSPHVGNIERLNGEGPSTVWATSPWQPISDTEVGAANCSLLLSFIFYVQVMQLASRAKKRQYESVNACQRKAYHHNYPSPPINRASDKVHFTLLQDHAWRKSDHHR